MADDRTFHMFNAAAELCAEAHASGDERMRDIAVDRFFRDHLVGDMKVRLKVFDSLVKRGVAREDVEIEVYARVLKNFERGNLVNYQVMRRIYNGACHDLERRAIREQPTLEDAIAHVAKLSRPSDEEQRRIREKLEEVLVELRSYSRWKKRVAIFEHMLATGDTNRAEIGRSLDIDPTTVRTTMKATIEWIQVRFPEHADFLGSPELDEDAEAEYAGMRAQQRADERRDVKLRGTEEDES